MIVWPHEMVILGSYSGKVETLDAKYKISQITSTLCHVGTPTVLISKMI